MPVSALRVSLGTLIRCAPGVRKRGVASRFDRRDPAAAVALREARGWSGRDFLEGIERVQGAVLQRIARGDESAVVACIEEFGQTVWALAHRYLAPLGDDLESAVQEVFTEIWQHAGRYDPSMGSEASFIATIAHRRLIDRRRKVLARPQLPLHEHAQVKARGIERDHAALKDEARLASLALSELAEDVRQCLTLTLYHGLSQSAISKSTGIPLGTVKTHIRTGLDHVRRALDEDRRDRQSRIGGRGSR